MLEQIRQDLRYCLRQLRRTPVVTLVASLSIAIAIGVVVIAFGLLNNILFRPVPLPDASRIHHVYASEEFREGQIERYGSSSYEDYLEYERSGAFGTLTAFTSRPTNVAITGRSPGMRWIA